MNLRKTILTLMLITGIASLQAETITQTRNFSGVPNLNSVLTFDKFNPARGVLTGVRVEMQLSTSGGQCGVDNDGAIGGSTTIQFGTEGKLTSVMPLVNGSWASILQQVKAYTAGSYSIAADNGDGPGNYDPNPPDWALHSGGTNTANDGDDINAGAIAAYNGTDTYTITAGIKTYYDFTGIGGADVLSSPPTANGYVRVIYTYNPYYTDIAVTKSVDSNTHAYLDVFPYTISIHNNGPDNATELRILDQVPSGLTIVTPGPTASVGTYTAGTGIWNIGNFANGADATLTINVRADQTGEFNNTASLNNVLQIDTNSSNNSDTEIVDVPPQSDLSLTKTVSSATPKVGQTIQYTLVLNNAGPSTATNVTVKDNLPAGLSYVSSSASRGSYNSGTGVWTISSVPVGNSTLTINTTVTASGARTNWARVTASDQYDPDSDPTNMSTDEDDDDDATITVPPSADLSLNKSVSPATTDLGNNVTFTLTLANAGPDQATNVTVSDVLPAGLSYVSSSTAKGSYSNATGVWTVGSMNNGESATLTITAQTTATGTLTNEARVMTSDQEDPDSTPGNDVPAEDDQDDAVVTVPRIVDLELTKVLQSAPSPLNLNDNVTFRITVSNKGPDNASGVAVRDLLTAGDFSYVSSSASQGSYSSSTGIWTVGNVNNGASATLDITARVLKTTPVTNTAQVSACDDNDTDSTPNNYPAQNEDDNASVTVDANPAADLRLDKNVSPATPTLGSNLTYTLTLVNDGPDGATNVTVADVLPAGLSYVSSNTAKGSFNSGSGTWTVGGMALNETATLTITATVRVTGPITNMARVMTSDQYDPDSTPGNDVLSEDDQDDAVVTVPRVVDLELAKIVQSAPTPLNLGDNVTFRVTVSNRGPDNATGVHVSDLLPAGDFTYVSSSASQGSYTSGTGDWNVGSLNKDASATLDITATVLKTSLITNTAQVSACNEGDSDSQPNNLPTHQDDDASVSVDAEPAADLRLDKGVSPSNINIGGNVTYTLTLVNDGPDAATAVSVEDVLPAGLNYVTSNTAKGSYSDATGIWTVGGMALNETAILTITASATALGSITNNAQVRNSDQYDPDSTPDNDLPSEDDQDDAVITVSPVADLRLTKTVDHATVDVADTVIYSITLNNDGPSTAHNVQVTDLLSSRLTYISHSGGTYSSSTGIWNVGTLTSGSSVQLLVHARVDSGGMTNNTAQVSQSDEYDPDSVPDNDNPAEDDQDDVNVTATAGSIGDYVWEDKDGEGDQDASETGMDGITVVLYRGSVKMRTAITDASGHYLFGSLPAGPYRVEVDETTVPYNFARTTDNMPYNVVLGAGDNHLNADFGYKAGEGSIGELVWHDMNANGIQDNGEPGLNEVTLILKNDRERVIATLQTNTEGWYRFYKLPPGTYTVEVDETTLPENFELTTGVQKYTVALTLDEKYRLANFGYRILNSRIGDYVWKDQDADKIQDASESGIPGVTVRLKQNNTVIQTAATGPGGLYLFSALAPGEYTVDLDETTLPAGYARTTDDASFTVTLNGLDAFLDADFGYRATAGSIGDTVWLDADGEGDQDASETGIPGVKVILRKGTTQVAAAITDADGFYLFENIQPGDYTVDVDNTSLPQGLVLTTANDPLTVSLEIFEDYRDADFGYQSIRGTIGDYVWYDQDAEGDQDMSESGIPGVVINLKQNSVVVQTDTTDSEGLYLFAELLPGNYTVDVDETTLPYGYVLSAGNEPDAVTLEPYEEHLTSDFGYKTSTGSIGDFVWHDANHDGIQDAGEPGLPDITVILVKNGQIYLQDTTDADGRYLFEKIPIGTYQVDVYSRDPDMPENFFNTTDNEPMTVTIDIGSENYLDADFGYAALQSGLGVIGDYAWHDANWNRNQDDIEEHLARVFVTLYLNGRFVKTKETDQYGFYHFTNLTAGEYDVVVDVYGPKPAVSSIAPAPVVMSKQTHNRSLLETEEWMITTIDSFHVSLAEGEIYLQADFGFAFPSEAVPGTIGDTVWLDADEDGVQDPEETGIPGITVNLIKKGVIVQSAITDANGLYHFENVFPGEYRVEVDAMSLDNAYKRTSANACYDLFLAGGMTIDTADFGYRKLMSWNDGKRYVLARYQPWFADAAADSSRRYWKDGVSDRPVIGEYDTETDEALWEYHILSAWGSGIDGFVVDWYGQTAFENAGLKGLLDKAAELNSLYEQNGFRFEIIVSYNEAARNSLDENLVYLADSIMTHEAYWGNTRGFRRPVYFFDNATDKLEIAEVRARVDALLPEDAFILWNEFETGFFEPADVCYSWVQPLEKSWDPDGKVWGETYLYTSYQRINSAPAQGKLLFALGTVWPGFDDRSWSEGGDRLIDRQDTLVYQWTWDLVHAYDELLPMPWCLIETWNDWNNGTGIEPGDTYEYDFTRLTRVNAARFKGLALGNTGIDETGMLALAHIYQARKLKALGLGKGDTETLLQQALDKLFDGLFVDAISAADAASGLTPPAMTSAATTDTSVTITWPPVSGSAGYLIYITSDSSAFAQTSTWPAPIEAGNVGEYTFTHLEPETDYYVAIAVVNDAAGDFSVPGWITSTLSGAGILVLQTAGTTSVENTASDIPETCELSQNYPNPFNPGTTIRYGLPENTDVRIQVFDTRGRLVATLADQQQRAGYHQVVWNGHDTQGQQVSSGTYIIKLTTKKQLLTRKVMLLK